MMEVDPAALEDLLRDVLGARAHLVHYHIAQQLDHYAVLIATLTGAPRRVTVKLAGPAAPFPRCFERTAALHRLVQSHTSVPVADVLGVDVSCAHWPWRYIVTAFIEGQEWAIARQALRGEELQTAYRGLGDAVAQIHSLGFQGFGDVNTEGIVPLGVAYLDALRERVSQRIAGLRFQEMGLSVLEDHRALFEPIEAASLCHEDLHQHNIVFAREAGHWRLAAILDFDKAWAGHHEADLARLEFWAGMTGPGFWEAYTASRPLSDLYPLRRPIHQFMWCLEFARNTPQHLADTRRLSLQLGRPPIEQFG